MLDSVMGGDFDMMLGTWGMDIDPDIMLMTLTTKGIDWQLNWSGYSNPEYDDLYLQQHRAKDDEARRGTIGKMFEIIDKDVPRIQLNVVTDFDVFRNDHIRFASRDTYMVPFQANTIYSFERVR